MPMRLGVRIHCEMNENHQFHLLFEHVLSHDNAKSWICLFHVTRERVETRERAIGTASANSAKFRGIRPCTDEYRGSTLITRVITLR